MAVAVDTLSSSRLACLEALEQKVLWLAVWMIHHANHVRPNRDGLKVGGHQASSASSVSLLTALYFEILRPRDRVAVKPHASPVFHAIQYLLGRQSREMLEGFRAYRGAQSYPSRTKDVDDVDFSTGSVGLGVAMTTFAALTRDYLRGKDRIDETTAGGRMIALAGDAEFDEGNVFEAMLEGWKHDVRNLWWIIDYNRQSLDAVIADRVFSRMDSVFRGMDWRVVTLKYGRLLESAFMKPGGDALRDWIDSCPNTRYSALAYKGGAAWREQLRTELGDVHGIRHLLDEHDDEQLARLMTNLGGHDLPSILEAFRSVPDDTPTCFIAYTIKGRGLPFAGHKDNHAGMMSTEQVAALKRGMRIADGDEWDAYAGLAIPRDELDAYLGDVAFAQPATRRHRTDVVAVPATFEPPVNEVMSTQQGFGRLLSDIARMHPELAAAIVTTAPDVTVSTNLGGWVNKQGIFFAREQSDTFKDERISSTQSWEMSPKGQHIELGIAENNLFILLAALGLAGPIFGSRLLPIGTVYDPFIARGLDALNYACYQDARFMLVATPSGLALSPEGGAHQSVHTPLIGIGQPGLTAFEPAYVDELSEILRWSFEHMQEEKGGSVYLRLSTRSVRQPRRAMTPTLRSDIVRGGYWMIPPSGDAAVAIVASGAVAPEAIEACERLAADAPGVGLLMVTSAGRLEREWRAAQRGGGSGSHVQQLLAELPPNGGIISVVDAHPATLGWLGGVRGHRACPLGVDRFGQSGDIPDLFHAYGIDADAIVAAARRLMTT